jgi:hypothetical protein
MVGTKKSAFIVKTNQNINSTKSVLRVTIWLDTLSHHTNRFIHFGAF